MKTKDGRKTGVCPCSEEWTGRGRSEREDVGGREAELSYRVLETAGGYSLLSVTLHTGRTHQIRVQFASRWLPLAGDVKYVSAVRDCPIALWSHTLAFRHPDSGEKLRFEALPARVFPWDLFDCLNKEALPCDTSR